MVEQKAYRLKCVYRFLLDHYCGNLPRRSRKGEGERWERSALVRSMKLQTRMRGEGPLQWNVVDESLGVIR